MKRWLVVWFALAMTRATAAEPIQLLSETDFGPWLLDPTIAVVLVRVEGVTLGTPLQNGDRPAKLRTRIETTLRGSLVAGDPLVLPFVKQTQYRAPIDKSRAFHDQWQEQAFHKGDELVFLLQPDGRAWTPLALLPIAPKDTAEVTDLTLCVAAQPIVDIAVHAIEIGHWITERYARAALEGKVMTRAEHASVISAALASHTLARSDRETWALYAQQVFDRKLGADATNVLVVKDLFTASIDGLDIDDLLAQFLVQDWLGAKTVTDRTALLRAIPPALRTNVARVFRSRAATATGDKVARYRDLIAVVAP